MSSSSVLVSGSFGGLCRDSAPSSSPPWETATARDAPPIAGRLSPVPIPVPPKYTGADFAKVSYWRNRGKLDVPKERFISYPKAGRDADKLVAMARSEAVKVRADSENEVDRMLTAARDWTTWARDPHPRFGPVR